MSNHALLGHCLARSDDLPSGNVVVYSGFTRQHDIALGTTITTGAAPR